MPIGEICNREVVIAKKDETAVQAAKLMRTYHVGDLVVVDERTGKRIPVGIVTDRDIVVELVGREVDPRQFSVGDIMSRELVTAREEDGIFETIQRMRMHGVRRVPVVDSAGALVGIVSIDDLFALLAEEMAELVKAISHEQAKESQSRT
jgi:CBS domain-containing protein